jgi:hypothetical protein
LRIVFTDDPADSTQEFFHGRVVLAAVVAHLLLYLSTALAARFTLRGKDLWASPLLIYARTA